MNTAHNISFHSILLLLEYDQVCKHTICPRHPVCAVVSKPLGKSLSGSLQSRLTGVSPQLSFWQSRPHCVNLWLDGSTIISPTVIAIPEQPGTWAGYLARSFKEVSAYPTRWLMLSHIVGTEVLANEYLVVKEHERNFSSQLIASEKGRF